MFPSLDSIIFVKTNFFDRRQKGDFDIQRPVNLTKFGVIIFQLISFIVEMTAIHVIIGLGSRRIHFFLFGIIVSRETY